MEGITEQPVTAQMDTEYQHEKIAEEKQEVEQVQEVKEEPKQEVKETKEEPVSKEAIQVAEKEVQAQDEALINKVKADLEKQYEEKLKQATEESNNKTKELEDRLTKLTEEVNGRKGIVKTDNPYKEETTETKEEPEGPVDPFSINKFSLEEESEASSMFINELRK